MASSFFVVSLVLEKLGDQLLQEASSLLGVGDQFEWVKSQFQWMQAFLKDAEAKSDKDERMKQWMREVRDVANLAEDIIDTFMVEAPPLIRGRGCSGVMQRCTSFFKEIHACWDLLSKIEKMKEKINSIKISRDAYGIQDIGQHEQSTSSPARSLIGRRRRLSSPYVEDTDLVGLETDRETLIRRLTQGEPQRNVISIVGMGGLGKTTLARKVYQTDDVKGHFNRCIWVTVLQGYDENELLRAVMRSCMDLTDEQPFQKMENDELCSKIAVYLRERRYLVVMDDVWKPDAWDAVKYAFPDSKNGSRVLVTTRNKEVALYMDANSQPHELRFLNEDDSWTLFIKKVSLGHETNLPVDAERRIRKNILSKCQGLPLAVVVLAGLLSMRKEAREWERILKTGWQLIEGEIGMAGILALSYRDLPCYLKPCFLYLGIFPEDYEIPAKKLIRMWVAEGFFRETGGLTLEEMGEECLHELIQRSLIQVSGTGSSGAVKSCRIHDLLRDLAILEANIDGFLEVDKDSRSGMTATASSPSCKSRRLAIHRKDRFDSSHHSNPSLRSLLICTQDFTDYYHMYRREKQLVLGSFKLLRVLDMECGIYSELPSEIGGLIHLRYLGYRGIRFEGLPSILAKLANLETISVTSREIIVFGTVPLSIGRKNEQLRHIKLKGEWWWIDLKEYPSDVEQLSSGTGGSSSSSSSALPLQTLANVAAGEWMKNDGFLERLSNLRKLGINICPMIKSESAEEAWKTIMRLNSLESLYVSTVEGGGFSSLGQVPPLNQFLPRLCKLYLEGLLGENHPSSVLCELPRNLTKLTLSRSMLNEDPLPILEKLENLRFLKLGPFSYSGQKMACSAGGFPQLQFLHFFYLIDWREWQVEKGSMRCLSHLTIDCCPFVMVFPEALQHISTLKTAVMYGFDLA